MSKSIRLREDDHVTLKNGRKGRVLEINGSRFCIEYDDTGEDVWIAVSSVAKVG